MIESKNVMVCKSCRKLYNSFAGKKMCPECEEEKRNEFRTVKDYIRTHKNAGVHEVAEACNVRSSQIIIWVREEKLFFANERAVRLPCMSCGAMISTGKYCHKCQADLAAGFGPSEVTKSYDASLERKKVSQKSTYISPTF